MMFEPTRDNCTIDGYSAKRNALWNNLDWENREWRKKSTLWVAIAGEDAPHDPHWRVPHKDKRMGTYHRVRLKRSIKSGDAKTRNAGKIYENRSV